VVVAVVAAPASAGEENTPIVETPAKTAIDRATRSSGSLPVWII
jgi:hypothetical protein